MSERHFHHTTYPFSDTDIDRTVKAVDIQKGDWVRWSTGAYHHYYRVISKVDTDHRVSLFFHGAAPKVYSSAEEVIVVKDPTVPVEDTEANNLLEQLRDTLDRTNQLIARIELEEDRRGIARGDLMDIHGNYMMTPLLTTKATLLVTITELRRSATNGALSDGIS